VRNSGDTKKEPDNRAKKDRAVDRSRVREETTEIRAEALQETLHANAEKKEIYGLGKWQGARRTRSGGPSTAL